MKMFDNPSLITRVAIGKGVGFLIGIVGFLMLPHFIADPSWQLRWGILLWYTTLGAIVGVFGVFNWHPILRLPMPWWIRAPILGAWMNFVLTLFAYDSFLALMTTAFGAGSVLTSPYWFILEGAVVGVLIGFLATRFGGEGYSTVENDAAMGNHGR